MKNPFRSGPAVWDLPEAKADATPDEQKSYDVLPEGIWQQLVAFGDLGTMPIELESAVGLPAVLAVIRFISHAAGMVPLNVLRGGPIREIATDAWQYRLLHDRPAPPPTTPFNLQADLAANWAGRGNAYVRKLKPSTLSPRLTRDTPRVTELMSLHAGAVDVTRADNGSVVYKDSTGQTPVDRGTNEIIQIRSFTVERDGLKGVSPITSARMFIGAGIKRNIFEERHLTNGISPSLGVQFPRGMTEQQANRWLDFLEQRHKGSGKAGKVLGFPADANVQAFPISLADALFADMTRLTMEQACAMWQVPLALMTPQRRPITDDEFRYFVTWALGPFLIAQAQAYKADDDLFQPYGPDDDLSVSPDTDSLLTMDALKKAQVQQQQVQGGLRLVDELRSQDGYGPLPPIPEDWQNEPGKVPQITPVGGAPNPEVNTGGPPVPTPGEEY